MFDTKHLHDKFKYTDRRQQGNWQKFLKQKYPAEVSKVNYNLSLLIGSSAFIAEFFYFLQTHSQRRRKTLATKAFKQEKIEDIRKTAQKAKVAIVSDYRGLTVEEITDLRRKLQAEKGDYVVLKNTLAKIAFKDTVLEGVEEYLKGPTAIAFGFEDQVSPAKVLTKFIKDKKKTEIRGGILDGKLLNPDEVKDLSNLPSKEELYAKILGSLNSPASGIVYSINAVMSSLVRAIDEVRKQKETASS